MGVEETVLFFNLLPFPPIKRAAQLCQDTLHLDDSAGDLRLFHAGDDTISHQKSVKKQPRNAIFYGPEVA